MTMVENCFDRWQKDVFFSAAEAVQESADVMQSIYRAWEREQRDGFQSVDSDELRRELHAALGTAKWQLEEFETAIKSSYQNGCAESTISRHRQFVLAIEDQISCVEKALRDLFIQEGKQPLRWVQLNEEERDDLAVFLSATPGMLQETKSRSNSFGPNEEHIVLGNQPKEATEIGVDADCVKGFKEIVTINKDAKYVVEFEAKEPPKTRDKIEDYGERINRPTGTSSSSDVGSWKIVIADEDVQRKTMEVKLETPIIAFDLCGLMTSVESTIKPKWLRNGIRKAKEDENLLPRQVQNLLDLRGNTWFPQGTDMLKERSRGCLSCCREHSNASRVQRLFRRVGGIKHRVQGSQYYVLLGRSFQIVLVFMLIILIIVSEILDERGNL